MIDTQPSGSDVAACSRFVDYCNSLLAGCCVKVIAPLRRVQNNAICDQPHGSHSAPLLRQLHWLPTTSRVQYKLCLLMCDVFHCTAPSYLTELCHVCNDDDYVPPNARTLLSSEQERGWQTAHSPWQGLQLGTPCLLNYETPHLGRRLITSQNCETASSSSSSSLFHSTVRHLVTVTYAKFHKGGGLHSANNKQKSLKTQYHCNRRHQL